MARVKEKKKKKIKNKWILLLSSFFVFLLLSVIGGYFALIKAGEQMIDEQKLHELKREATVIYDKYGNEVDELYVKENREYVPIDQIPEHVIKAFLAVEDRRFYEHKGVDFIRLAGAIFNDIRKGELAEGGSTITQQLARNIFLSLEKTFWRKTKELSIALALERKYSKDQIMEMYLNEVFLGNNSFGIQTAAKTYFNKSVQELTLADAATLAAIPKAPSVYNPFANREKAKERRDTILRLMMEEGFISKEEKEQAQQEPLPPERDFSDPEEKGYRAYVDYVIREAEERYGISQESLYRGGWKIYTALDPKMQDAMIEAYNDPDNFPAPGKERVVESAMVVVDPKTGGIAAMMGGRNYKPMGFNFAVDAKRQPGSSFKPIAVYAPALETGKWEPYSLLSNEKQDFNGYRPRNYNNKYSKSVPMMEAVRDSLNIPAVWLLDQIGVQKGVDSAVKFGIEMQPEDRNLAIALGGLSKGTSPLAMAQAYTAFANGGVMSEAHAILKMEEENVGTVVTAKLNQTAVISPQSAWYMHTMLEGVVKYGTGKAAWAGRPTAGKTGTTQSEVFKNNSRINKDAWFVGYTPEYVGAVWMGFEPEDENHAMRSGSAKTAALFAKVFKKGLKDVKREEFKRPPGVENPEKPVTVTAPQLSAVVTIDGQEPKLLLSWSGNADIPLTYDIYRLSDTTGSRELVQAGVKGNTFVIPLIEPVQFSYQVVPIDTEGNEGPPSNIAKPDFKPLEQFYNDDQMHNDEDPGLGEGEDWDGDGLPDQPEQPGEDSDPTNPDNGDGQNPPPVDPNSPDNDPTDPQTDPNAPVGTLIPPGNSGQGRGGEKNNGGRF